MSMYTHLCIRILDHEYTSEEYRSISCIYCFSSICGMGLGPLKFSKTGGQKVPKVQSNAAVCLFVCFVWQVFY